MNITTIMTTNKITEVIKVKAGSLHNAPNSKKNKVISNKSIYEPLSESGTTLNKSLKVKLPTQAKISEQNIPLALAKKLNEARKEFLHYKNLAQKEVDKQSKTVRPHSFLGGVFGLDSLTNEMSKVNEFLTSEQQTTLLANVTKVAGESSTLLNTVNGIFSTASSAFSNMLYELKGLLNEDKAHLLKGLAFGLLVHQYYDLPNDTEEETSKWKVKMICLSMLNLYAWRKPLADFPEATAKFITCLVSFNDVDHAQIQYAHTQSKDDNFKALSGFVGIMYFIITGGKAYSAGQEKTVLKLFTEIPRVASGASIFIEFGSLVLKTLMSFVGAAVLGRKTMDWIYGPGEKRITDFENRFEEVRDQNDRSELEPTMKNLELINELMNEAKNIRKDFPRNGGSDVSAVMTDIIRELQSIRTVILARKPALEGRRVEPVGLYLAGPPGVYKTETLDWVSRIIHYHVFAGKRQGCLDDTPSADIYAIRKSKYMDGYASQRIIVIDDIFQDVDIKGQEDSEAKKIIDMINTPALRVNMAELSAKGTTYFKGEFVMVSSNVAIPEPESIISPEALTRRFDYKYFVCAKPEYMSVTNGATSNDGPMNRRIDVSKLPVNSKGETIIRPMDILQFLPYNNEGKQCGPPEEFDDVIDKLIRRHHQKSIWLENAQDELNHYLTGLTPSEERNFHTSFASYLNTTPVKKLKVLNDIAVYFDLDEPETNLERFERVVKYLNKHHSLEGSDIEIFDTTLIDKLFRVGIDQFEEEHPFRPAVETMRKYYLTETFKVMSTGIWEKVVSSVKHGKEYFTFLLPNNYTTIVSTVLSLLAVLAGTAAISNMILSFWSIVVPQSTNPRIKERVVTRNLAEEFKAMTQQVIPTVQSSNCSYTSMLDSKIQRNLLSFEIRHPDNDMTKPGYALVLSGRKIIFPYHFVTQMFTSVKESPSRIHYPVILTSITGRKHEIDVSYILSNHYGSSDTKARDLIFLELPEISQPHPDITSLFITKKDWSRVSDRVTSRIYTHDKKHLSIFITPASFTTATKVVDDVAGENFTLEGLYTYDTVVKAGDCGAPFTCPNTGKILGFHVAGSPVAGFAKVFLVDWIEEKLVVTQNAPIFNKVLDLTNLDFEPKDWLCNLNNWNYPHYESGVSLEIKDTEIENCGRKIIGSVNPQPTAPTKSTLRRSNMYGKLSVQSMRAPSSLFNLKQDVLEYSLSRYCNNVTKFDPDLLKSLAEKKLDHLNRVSAGKVYTKSIYTYEQSISGYYEPCDYGELKPLPGINLSTSSGFPGNVTGKAKKRDYFGDGEFPDFDTKPSKELKVSCLDVIENAKKGIPSLLPFTDFPKDELLKIQKVIELKTRLISGSCLILIVCIKMYCDDFSMMLLDNRIKNNSCLGINEVSSEWDTLYKHLTKFGPNIIVGDFSGFDTCHTYSLIMFVCYIINKWYDDNKDNQTVRWALFQSIALSSHIRDGKLEVWVGGMPSGNPLTAIINTLINELLMMYFYNESVPKGIGSYHDNVRACFVGDDNGQGVSKEAQPYFNGKTIERLASTIGYKFTSEDKDSEVQETKPITDSTFLKRRWRYDEDFGRVVGPISLETIYDMCVWGNKKFHSTIQHEKVDTALYELALHGREVYSSVGKEIKEVYYSSYPGAGELRNTSFIEIVERLTQ